MLRIFKSIVNIRHLSFRHIGCFQVNSREFCTIKNEPVNEQRILEKLRGRFPTASSINVEDTSGGCGAMFNVRIESSEFKDLSIPKQHRIVYDTLKDEISKIHGLHLETKVSG